MARETELKSKLTSHVRSYHKDWYVISLAASQFGQPGIPDTFFLHESMSIFVEFKGSETVFEKHQVRQHDLIRATGGFACVVRFVSNKEWTIGFPGELHRVEFTNFKEGVKLLLDVLKKLAEAYYSEKRGGI